MIYKISIQQKSQRIVSLFSANKDIISTIYRHHDISQRLKALQSLPEQLSYEQQLPKQPLITPPQITLTTAKQLLYYHKNNKTKPNLIILHSLAFIQFNAFQAYADTLLRFAYSKQHEKTWSTMKASQLKSLRLEIKQVAIEQGQHCLLLIQRLQQLNCKFGDFPVITNLANMVNTTTQNILDRLALISIVSQGRGMKSIEKLINKVLACQDKKSATLLKKIQVQEIKHFTLGLNWFQYFCNIKYLEHIKQNQVKQQLNNNNYNNYNSYMDNILQQINIKYKTKITQEDLKLPKIKNKCTI